MRALRETVTDARHEWRRPGFAVKLTVVARLPVAIARVLAMTLSRDCAVALRSPFAWRWLALSLGLAALTLATSLLGRRRSLDLDNLGVMDIVVAFLFATPVTLLPVALSGRRTDRLPVTGLTALAGIVLAIMLLVALPIGMARSFATFAQGRLFVTPDWLMVTSFGVPCLVFCWCGLNLADRARSHARRGFVSCLALLLPVLGLVLAMQWRSDISRGFEIAAVFLSAALPLAIMSRVIGRPTNSEEVQS